MYLKKQKTKYSDIKKSDFDKSDCKFSTDDGLTFFL